MGVILIIWVIIVIVELVYTFSQEEDKAEINCIYYISKAGANTTLLGSDFNFNSISQIVIDDDDEITDPIKEYKFKKVGNHTVKIYINDTINMDYMFKDVNNLISVKMTTNNSTKIASMRSSFQNCKSLVEFSIKGFDTKKLNNTSHMFDSCEALKSLKIEIDTKNVVDMSYMFYRCMKSC